MGVAMNPTHSYEDHKVQYYLQEAAKGKEPEQIKWYKRKAVDFLIPKIFESCLPVSGDGEIVVAGHVMADGKGDWAAMVNICKHIQKKYPERTVRLIALSDGVHTGRLQAPNIKAVDLAYESNDDPEAANKFFTVSHLAEKVKNAALIISGPIAIPKILDPLKDEIKNKTLAFNEYDAMTNFNMDVKKTIRSGLGPTAIGIFTNSFQKEYKWTDIKNERLKEILFGTPNPGDEKIQEYLENSIPFFCYMGQNNALRFISDAASYAQKIEGNKTIDICYPSKEKLENIENKISNNIDLINLGVATVKIIT